MGAQGVTVRPAGPNTWSVHRGLDVVGWVVHEYGAYRAVRTGAGSTWHADLQSAVDAVRDAAPPHKPD